MWGRPSALNLFGFGNGNTPTHVGKTYPRLRDGESPRETPPRMWGRLIPPDVFRIYRRNTPTHVGKTEKKDHAKDPDLETPPRMWGRQRTLSGSSS